MRVISLVLAAALWSGAVDSASHSGYTNEWVAEVEGGQDVAQRIAEDMGFTFRRELTGLKGHYIMSRDDLPAVSDSGSRYLTSGLLSLPEVKWADQQKLLRITSHRRLARDDKEKKDGVVEKGVGKSVDDERERVKKERSYQPNIEKLGTFSTRPLRSYLRNYKGPTKNIGLFSSKISAYNNSFNDELWPKQWYFQDYRTEDGPVMDHNVVPVYRRGITGKGVTVAVVDSGVQQDHEDLGENFIENLSYDFINDVKGSNPGFITTDDIKHGTNCAGVVAMLSNNTKCGVGVAFHAKVAGIMVVGQKSTDYQYGDSLLHAIEATDIYTNSWAGDDSGKAPLLLKDVHLSFKSIEYGIWQGRQGKGAVYVFSSGNSRSSDHCAADEFYSSPNTILVAAANQLGEVSRYSEKCAAIMTTAYSGCRAGLEKVIGLSNDGTCTTDFSGTSAATPIIAGILALVLQANNNLTYRDVQHLVTMSSEVAPLANNKKTWSKNGAGFWVSNDFGFGLLNAENIVLNALSWKNVPGRSICRVSKRLHKKLYFDIQESVLVGIPAFECRKHPYSSIQYLEQVELASDVESVYRGALGITLVSPKGTKTVMMAPREKDTTRGSFDNFTIMSTQTWGEDPHGVWWVEIKASYKLTGMRALYDHIVHTLSKPVTNGPAGYRQTGYVKGFALKFYGTTERPHEMRRTYAGFRLPGGRTDLT